MGHLSLPSRRRIHRHAVVQHISGKVASTMQDAEDDQKFYSLAFPIEKKCVAPRALYDITTSAQHAHPVYNKTQLVVVDTS